MIRVFALAVATDLAFTFLVGALICDPRRTCTVLIDSVERVERAVARMFGATS